MRTVSLLPAATEIVGVLGLMDQLVGISHDCDFPAEANTKPRVTSCKMPGNDIASRDIDAWVTEQVQQGADLYTLDECLLRELHPELILTQKLCDVCAPAYGTIAALAATLPGPPRVINLEPTTLDDIFNNIRTVAVAMNASEIGTRVLQQLHDRVEQVKSRLAQTTKRPRVVLIEWLDPLFCSGHWTPELIEIAGGIEVLGGKWQHSVRKTWDDVRHADPEILIIACCGQTESRALRDWNRIKSQPEVASLPAVQSGRVVITDGNAFFNRPGPRVVDALEYLARIFRSFNRNPKGSASRV